MEREISVSVQMLDHMTTSDTAVTVDNQRVLRGLSGGEDRVN